MQFLPTQPVLLQDHSGLSRKGADSEQASYCCSQPQLATRGRLSLQGRSCFELQGAAWLDHEWSEVLMHPEAVGWDWIGMDLWQRAHGLSAAPQGRLGALARWIGP